MATAGCTLAEPMLPDLYSDQERHRIIRGYQKLDGLTDLLREASRCRACHDAFPDRPDLPVNALVRPLPALKGDDEIRRYLIRVKRDDTFLRNLMTKATTAEQVTTKLKGARFAIGVLPWLDRCMLLRRGKSTKLMVVGIDYKHFPVFFDQGRDHCFPLDSYRTRTNVWGKSWRMFWSGLFGQYDDDAVSAFIAQHGVYFTNSMLCFGGSTDPNDHSREHVECCRRFIERQIEIVRPEVLVSFGDIGAWNVATILLGHDEGNRVLRRLASSRHPLREVADMVSSGKMIDGIDVRLRGHRMKFWPLYQPARRHLHGFEGDYAVLRTLLGS
ncbi:MAG TPA: uracil-DNA glycosylase family protein [Bacillota bacterium]|nr:uracil-DNA glycosylase family protein [Bacillota bacterium]